MSIGSENQPLFTPSDFNKSFNSAAASPVLPDSGQPAITVECDLVHLSLLVAALLVWVEVRSTAYLHRACPSIVPKASFSANRPSTAQRPADLKSMSSRMSRTLQERSPSVRPGSAVSSQQAATRIPASLDV